MARVHLCFNLAGILVIFVLRSCSHPAHRLEFIARHGAQHKAVAISWIASVFAIYRPGYLLYVLVTWPPHTAYMQGRTHRARPLSDGHRRARGAQHIPSGTAAGPSSSASESRNRGEPRTGDPPTGGPAAYWSNGMSSSGTARPVGSE